MISSNMSRNSNYPPHQTNPFHVLRSTLGYFFQSTRDSTEQETLTISEQPLLYGTDSINTENTSVSIPHPESTESSDPWLMIAALGITAPTTIIPDIWTQIASFCPMHTLLILRQVSSKTINCIGEILSYPHILRERKDILSILAVEQLPNLTHRHQQALLQTIRLANTNYAKNSYIVVKNGTFVPDIQQRWTITFTDSPVTIKYLKTNGTHRVITKEKLLKLLPKRATDNFFAATTINEKQLKTFFDSLSDKERKIIDLAPGFLVADSIRAVYNSVIDHINAIKQKEIARHHNWDVCRKCIGILLIIASPITLLVVLIMYVVCNSPTACQVSNSTNYVYGL